MYETVLEDVPSGAYRIELRSDKLLAEGAREVQAGDSVLFTYERPRPDEAYRFEVLDAESGRPLSFYALLPGERGREPILAEHPGQDGVHAYGLPAGDPVEWCIVCVGRKRAYGDRGAFEHRPPGYVATVRLERGFSMRVIALHADGRPAIGAELVLADRTFTTDLDGRALIESDIGSPSLRLRAAGGWRIVGGEVDDAGQMRLDHAELRVVVEREP